MTTFTPLITTAGWQALTNTQSTKKALVLSHIALGSGNQLVSPNDTQLACECQRVPILESRTLTAQHIQLLARIEGTLEYWVYEWGLYLDDGTLFAIWRDSTALAYKAKNVDLMLTLDVVLNQLPAESFAVTETKTLTLNLGVTESLTILSRVMIDMMQREVNTRISQFN